MSINNNLIFPLEMEQVFVCKTLFGYTVSNEEKIPLLKVYSVGVKVIASLGIALGAINIILCSPVNLPLVLVFSLIKFAISYDLFVYSLNIDKTIDALQEDIISCVLAIGELMIDKLRGRNHEFLNNTIIFKNIDKLVQKYL
ncbi:MAG: hypothetical protein A3F40_02315 [Chlamydiae bacterium RIFCSPHIGHO2_12_FULL_27_8]|nr:MAG: hypothetical protein A3F40_02315 [Chlamydiae bacterium RIFCSPHIGHO2_12_FULL_27_8]